MSKVGFAVFLLLQFCCPHPLFPIPLFRFLPPPSFLAILHEFDRSRFQPPPSDTCSQQSGCFPEKGLFPIAEIIGGGEYIVLPRIPISPKSEIDELLHFQTLPPTKKKISLLTKSIFPARFSASIFPEI